MIKKRVRHLHRLQEILNAFVKNGLGFFVKELGLLELVPIKSKVALNRKEDWDSNLGEKVRFFLEDLGPTFIKLGQIASTRPDMVPPSIIRELSKLHDNVPSFAFANVKRIIEEEFGERFDQVFDGFSEQPIAAASIGQVHHAILKTKEHVVVKIQRPNIESIINTDLEILAELARLAENRVSWVREYHIREMINEFSKALRTELDFNIEARNTEKMAKRLKGNPEIHVPNIYWDYTSKRVLTLEFFKGLKINDPSLSCSPEYDLKVVAGRYAHTIFHQIVVEGFFHGDPHPGNVLVLPGNEIGLIDFGLVGSLTPEMKYHFASLVLAMKQRNTDGAIQAISQMGVVPDDVNMASLRADLDVLRDKYYDVSLSTISITEAVGELLDVIYTHRIEIPTNITILGKTLLIVEGVIEEIDPEFSVFDIVEPFGKQIIIDRFHPKKIILNMWDQLSEYREIFTHMPKKLYDLTSVMKKGKLHIEITSPKDDYYLKRLNQITNRIVMGILFLAVSVIFLGLVIGNSVGNGEGLFWGLPVLEIWSGFILIFFLCILFIIFRSGRM